MRWRGTHWLVEVAVDPLANVVDFEPLRERVDRRLQTYKRMGHRVRVVRGRQVPLEIHLQATVKRGYPRGDVRRALMDLFSSRLQANGEPGLFHPDLRTFGQHVYVSELVLAATKVPGVENVVITWLSRRGGENVAADFDEQTQNTNETSDSVQTTGQPANSGQQVQSELDDQGEAQSDDRSNVLEMGPLEIAQLENTQREETGHFCLTLEVEE